MPDTFAPTIPSTHALCAYAEPFVTGRRIVVIGGERDDAFATRLMELGARVVHAHDITGRVGKAHAVTSRGRSVRELGPGDFAVREGAFDLGIVPDLGAADDVGELLSRVRRFVGREGSVLVSAANPDAPGALRGVDYYELYDAVSLQFANVRMIAEVPFLGVTLAELGAAEVTSVTVDTQLAAGADVPVRFVVFGAQRKLALTPYSIVKLPFARLGEVSAAPESASPKPVVRPPSAAPARPPSSAPARPQVLPSEPPTDRDSTVIISAPQAILREKDLRIAQLEGELAHIVAQGATDRDARLAELARVATEETKGREARIPELEAELAKAAARAGDEHVRAERLGTDIRDLKEELERQRARFVELRTELEKERKRRQDAEVQFGMSRAAAGDLQSARTRIVELEAALAASEQAIAQLRVDAEAALAVERARADAADGAAADLARRLTQLEDEAAHVVEGHIAELARAEAMLLDRAQTVQALHADLLRRERMVQELVSALEEAGEAAPPPLVDADRSPDPQEREARIEPLARENAELRHRLDTFAAEIARREADAQATAWRIAELEQRVGLASVKQADQERVREVEPPTQELDSQRGST